MLVLPWFIAIRQIISKCLPRHPQRLAIKADFSLNYAVFGLNRDELQSFPLPDFRRLAAKKADASSKNSFNSLSRLISLSRSFNRRLNSSFSAASVSAVSGLCSPCPKSICPLFALCTHPLSVPSGIPSSAAAAFVPLVFASFTACTLYSLS